MIKIESLLCPVDVTVETDAALRYAAALARAYQAKLFICHGDNTGRDARADARRRVEALISRSLGTEASEIGCEILVIENERIAEGITRAAAERHVSLIVMRSRRRPHAAMLLGSTTEAVCRIAPCPVLVTHADEREFVSAYDNRIDIRRVLVACDFSNDSELALQYGLRFAQENRAEISLLHVLPAPIRHEPEIRWAGPFADGEYHKAARRLQAALPSESHSACRVRHAVRWGKPYREVLAYAREHKIDLVCMGAHGADFGLGALFGSNVDRVLRHAPCPVLVARPLKPLFEQDSTSAFETTRSERA